MNPQQTKDLLIHAAKAAGLEGYTFQEATPLQSAMMVRRNIDEHGWDIGVQDFDPINCDGDAFWLICHKRMDVYVNNVLIAFTSGSDGFNQGKSISLILPPQQFVKVNGGFQMWSELS